jgi:hypothetical protein
MGLFDLVRDPVGVEVSLPRAMNMLRAGLIPRPPDAPEGLASVMTQDSLPAAPTPRKTEAERYIEETHAEITKQAERQSAIDAEAMRIVLRNKRANTTNPHQQQNLARAEIELENSDG